MKKVYAINPDGTLKIGLEELECGLHDRIAEKMFEDILKTRRNCGNVARKNSKIEQLMEFYPNIHFISEAIGTLFVLEFFRDCGKLMGAFTKREDDYLYLADYEDSLNSRNLVLEELNRKLQIYLGGENYGNHR